MRTKTAVVCIFATLLLIADISLAREEAGLGTYLGYFAVGVGTILAAPIVLPAVGFTAAGVGAGSLAALAHSAIGNVAVGSAFAALQSAGATGAISAAGNVILGTVGTAGAAAVHRYSRDDDD